MIEALSYGFMQKAMIGGIAIALITGLIGPFLVLRRLSLLGDGLAHLAFGGVALGLFLNLNPMLVTLVVVLVGSLFIQKWIKKNEYGDAVIALVLSFGLGLGIIIAGAVNGFTVDLFSFLIGSILTLSTTDLVLIGSTMIVTLLFVTSLYPTLVSTSFNAELARLTQKKYKITDLLFTLVVALAVVVSIRAVGILLVSALLVIPSLIALKLAKSFKGTIRISILTSILVMIGGIISSFYLDLPPSGIIVMLFFTIYAGSTLFIKIKQRG